MILLYEPRWDHMILYWYNGKKWMRSTYFDLENKWGDDMESYMETEEEIKDLWSYYDLLHEELP